MARRKQSDRNSRKLFNLAGGKSRAITLPLETLRAWGWDTGTELTVKEDPKRHTFTIETKKP